MKTVFQDEWSLMTEVAQGRFYTLLKVVSNYDYMMGFPKKGNLYLNWHKLFHTISDI